MTFELTRLNIFKAFFYEIKRGGTDSRFSTKKFYAFIFVTIAIYNNVTLVWWTVNHWIVKLVTALKAVPLGDEWISTIIIVLVGVINGLALGALGVYGWSKVKGGS